MMKTIVVFLLILLGYPKAVAQDEGELFGSPYSVGFPVDFNDFARRLGRVSIISDECIPALFGKETNLRVFVEFEVPLDGYPEDIHIIRGICPESDSQMIEPVRKTKYSSFTYEGVPVVGKTISHAIFRFRLPQVQRMHEVIIKEGQLSETRHGHIIASIVSKIYRDNVSTNESLTVLKTLNEMARGINNDDFLILTLFYRGVTGSSTVPLSLKNEVGKPRYGVGTNVGNFAAWLKAKLLNKSDDPKNTYFGDG